MKGTLLPLQWLGSWTHGTLGQVRLRHAGEPGKVVVTGCAEVGGTKAEVDGNRAAVAALVLEEVSTMLGTHLQGGRGRQESVTPVTTLALVSVAHYHSPTPHITPTQHITPTHHTPHPLGQLSHQNIHRTPAPLDRSRHWRPLHTRPLLRSMPAETHKCMKRAGNPHIRLREAQ